MFVSLLAALICFYAYVFILFKRKLESDLFDFIIFSTFTFLTNLIVIIDVTLLFEVRIVDKFVTFCHLISKNVHDSYAMK